MTIRKRRGALAAQDDPAEDDPEQDDPAETDDAASPPGWQAVLVIEDEWTTDGRFFAPGSFTWRELPLPLMVQDTSGHGDFAAPAWLGGNIETIERVGNELRATGTFLESEEGDRLRGFVEGQTLRFVSVDTELIDWEVEIPDEDQPGGATLSVSAARLMGATVVPMPAFPSAVIVMEGATIPEATPDGRGPGVVAAATASEDQPAAEDGTEADEADEVQDTNAAPPAARALSIVAAARPAPPASWFDNPNLSGPTPLTITPDGRIYGHAALWGTCHTGERSMCLTPPRSRSDYSYFRTGCVPASGSDGCIPVGQITMGTGHFDPRNPSAMAAAAHYDHTGSGVADVASGEDAYGLWVAGAERFGLSDEDRYVLQASALSGDWRSIGGHLELVALLVVNVPGFPVPRSIAAAGVPLAEAAHSPAAVFQGGQMVSLVAAGMFYDAGAALQARVTRLESALASMVAVAHEKESARVRVSMAAAQAATVTRIRSRNMQ